MVPAAGEVGSNAHETRAVWGEGWQFAERTINENEVVLMLTETVNRRLEALATISQHGKRLNGLFRLMENPLLWHEAYANIYANMGALTEGVDEVTLDGFSESRVASIIMRLKAGTSRFKPVRRTYILKAENEGCGAWETILAASDGSTQ